MSAPIHAGFRHAIAVNLTYWQQKAAAGPMAVVQREAANARRAIDFGIQIDECRPVALELLLALFPSIERSGNWRPWEELFRQATRLPEHDRSGRLFNCYGQLLRRLRHLKDAEAAHLAALELAQRRDQSEIHLAGLFNLSEIYRLQKADNLAREYAERALAAATKTAAPPKWRASILNTLGLLALDQAKTKQAIGYLAESAAAWGQTDNDIEKARTHNNWANALSAAGRFDEAEPLYQQAEQTFATAHSPLDTCRVLLSLGTLYYRQGKYEDAVEAFRRADTAALRRSGDRMNQGIQAQNLGNALIKLKRFAEAEPHLERSRRCWLALGNQPLMLANTLGTLAEAYAGLNNAEIAIAHFENALEILADQSSPLAQRLYADFAEQLQRNRATEEKPEIEPNILETKRRKRSKSLPSGD